jgi:hypothetical protein
VAMRRRADGRLHDLRRVGERLSVRDHPCSPPRGVGTQLVRHGVSNGARAWSIGVEGLHGHRVGGGLGVADREGPARPHRGQAPAPAARRRAALIGGVDGDPGGESERHGTTSSVPVHPRRTATSMPSSAR